MTVELLVLTRQVWLSSSWASFSQVHKEVTLICFSELTDERHPETRSHKEERRGREEPPVCGSNCRCYGRLSNVTQQHNSDCKSVLQKTSCAAFSCLLWLPSLFPFCSLCMNGTPLTLMEPPLQHSPLPPSYTPAPPALFLWSLEKIRMWESTHKQACARNMKCSTEQRDYAAIMFVLSPHPLISPSFHLSIHRCCHLDASYLCLPIPASTDQWLDALCWNPRTSSTVFRALPTLHLAVSQTVFSHLFLRQAGKSIHPRVFNVLLLKYY